MSGGDKNKLGKYGNTNAEKRIFIYIRCFLCNWWECMNWTWLCWWIDRTTRKAAKWNEPIVHVLSSPLSLFFPILSLSRSASPLDLFSWISCPGPQKLQVLLQWDLELQLQGLDLGGCHWLWNRTWDGLWNSICILIWVWINNGDKIKASKQAKEA